LAKRDRDFLTVLIVPDLRACAKVIGSPVENIDPVQVVNDPDVRRHFVAALKHHGDAHPGNSTRVERAVLLAEPLSLDHGEVTDKGSVNQRSVLARRDALVNDLYRWPTQPHVLEVR
jgi:feruloyl-CoA synthase